ncbi:MAG: methionine--tRNA ligase [Patescibacteria group bacterium]
MREKFYITTAIDYVNAPPHLGHALEKVQADAIARYQRLLGKEVYFLTGTDEHGIKIVQSAQNANKTIEEFSQKNTAKFRELIKQLNISNDDFIRTSDQKRHWPGAQKLWKELVKTGDIYKSKYQGYYCVGCEAYITEKDLINGKCPYHEKEPELIEEENYFFRLSKYANQIKKEITSNRLIISPKTRKNEVLAMFERRIEDISFSRPREKLNWGVPVPEDDSQIIYVWCDALSNYISALGYGSNDDSNFKKYWPADIHIVGKDILRFHAIIWPGMLLSIGIDLPKRILVHGFILSEGKRMSKTLGNVIDPFDLIKEYGTDALRYYLLREVTLFEDGDITLVKFQDAYNANLANGLGNLVNRIMKMSEQNVKHSVLNILRLGTDVEYRKLMDNFELSKALDLVWVKISELDLRIQATQPFKLIKTDKNKAEKIIRDLIFNLAEIAFLLKPFLPETSDKILKAIELNKMPPPLFLRKE